MKTNHRVRGIIIKDNQILAVHRVKNDDEYFSLPGGGVEEGETAEEALIREIKEETNLNVENFSELFTSEFVDDEKNEKQVLTYYLVQTYSGSDIKLGGPELERHNDQNQYHLEWHDLDKFFDLPSHYQPAVLERLKLSLSKK